VSKCVVSTVREWTRGGNAIGSHAYWRPAGRHAIMSHERAPYSSRWSINASVSYLAYGWCQLAVARYGPLMLPCSPINGLNAGGFRKLNPDVARALPSAVAHTTFLCQFSAAIPVALHEPDVPPTHAKVWQPLPTSPTSYSLPFGHVHMPPACPTPDASSYVSFVESYSFSGF
jgi:hypothetical protein